MLNDINRNIVKKTETFLVNSLENYFKNISLNFITLDVTDVTFPIIGIVFVAHQSDCQYASQFVKCLFLKTFIVVIVRSLLHYRFKLFQSLKKQQNKRASKEINKITQEPTLCCVFDDIIVFRIFDKSIKSSNVLLLSILAKPKSKSLK